MKIHHVFQPSYYFIKDSKKFPEAKWLLFILTPHLDSLAKEALAKHLSWDEVWGSEYPVGAVACILPHRLGPVDLPPLRQQSHGIVWARHFICAAASPRHGTREIEREWERERNEARLREAERGKITVPSHLLFSGSPVIYVPWCCVYLHLLI